MLKDQKLKLNFEIIALLKEIFILDSINLMDTPSDMNSTKNGIEDNEEDGFYTLPNSKIENNNTNSENHMPSMTRTSRLNLRQSSKSNFINDAQLLTSSSNHLDKLPGLNYLKNKILQYILNIT